MNLGYYRNAAVKNVLRHSRAGEEANIFISYAQEDAASVLPWVGELEEAGLCVQHDQGGFGTGQWFEELAGIIDRCVGMVYVISPQSLVSSNCQMQMMYALRAGKVVAFTTLENLNNSADANYANA